MKTLYIKCRKATPDAAKIVEAFAKCGVVIKKEQVRVPVFYDGPNKGTPRNFAFVHSVAPSRADVLLALEQINFEGAVFLISEARPRIPARFSNQEMSPVFNQQHETKIVRKGQRTKSFEESEFRG